MEQRKDIEEHIGQQLQGLSQIPGENVWSNIENTLDAQDKRRRRFILWWWLFGLLVAFLLFFFGNSLWETNVVTTKTNSEEPVEKSVSVNPDSTSILTLEADEVTKNMDFNSTQEIHKTFQDTIRKGQNKQKIRSTNVSTSETNTLFSQTKVIITTTSEKTSLVTPDSIKKEPINDGSKKSMFLNSSEISEKNRTANATNFETTSKETTKSSGTNFETENLSEREQLKLQNKKRIDSIKKIRAEKRTIYASEVNTTPDSIEEKASKWSVTAIVGPTYFNTFKNNATLDQDLTNATNSGHITFSYGAGINFNLTKNILLSFGVIKNNLTYNVDNIPSATTAQQGAILSYSGINLSSNANEESLNTFVGENTVVSLLQEINYTEIPLEVTYQVTQGTLGIQARGGFSVYITGNDTVYVEKSNGDTFMLGEANNLSKANYSVNAGLGGFYKFSEKITLEVMPTFKYQFNTLNNINYDSKTYVLGVYTGIRYSF